MHLKIIIGTSMFPKRQTSLKNGFQMPECLDPPLPTRNNTRDESESGLAFKVCECIPCHKAFRSRTAFLQHEDAKHSMEMAEATEPAFLETQDPKDTDEPTHVPVEVVRSGFRCTPCNESFRSQYILAKHWENEHLRTWWDLFDEANVSEVSLTYSEFEDYDNYDEDDMYDDLMEITANQNSWRSKNKIHCITCWKKFKTSSEMMNHMEMGKCHSYLDRSSIISAIKSSDEKVADDRGYSRLSWRWVF
ncbi:uncharacterized protein BKA55DRAFT_548128 [Fusarium redolens]|uniref:C2H2-type domain-containing protein n=1 Tax=Fusarium redolens TaxID=48865 RepID=A0A9P9KVE0_FUSRE|nr:uncharacterized protein BKA55DRAFT_548128 [Fusarium redolens]KAH7269252.1 hypothetical protein BKA55DRAFT_548128 [Fusarium redolens]